MRIADEKSQETAEEGTIVSSRLFLFLILGFVLVFIGIIVILAATSLYAGDPANVGAVIFVGPFPIVTGAGSDATWIVLFSIVLAVLSVVVFLVINRRMRRSGG
jgi:uncharacterized membrane protein